MSRKLKSRLRSLTGPKRPTLKEEKSKGRSDGRPQRMLAAERRASILQATTPIFAQRGFYGTTTRELTSAAGIAQPTVYLHFQDKEGLYRAVLENQAQDLLAQFLDGTIPEPDGRDEASTLTDLADRLLQRMENDQNLIRLFFYGVLERVVGCKVLLGLHCVLHQQVESRLAARRSELERVLLARCFVGLIFHLD